MGHFARKFGWNEYIPILAHAIDMKGVYPYMFVQIWQSWHGPIDGSR